MSELSSKYIQKYHATSRNRAENARKTHTHAHVVGGRAKREQREERGNHFFVPLRGGSIPLNMNCDSKSYEIKNGRDSFKVFVAVFDTCLVWYLLVLPSETHAVANMTSLKAIDGDTSYHSHESFSLNEGALWPVC